MTIATSATRTTTKNNETLLFTALTATAAAATTYLLTRHYLQSKSKEEALTEAAAAYAEKSVAQTRRESLDNAEKKGKQGPSGTKLPNVQIDEVYLWEVEHLSVRFPSEGSHIINHMHGIDRDSTPLPENTPVFRKIHSSNSEEDMTNKSEHKVTSYNKLIGIHECILSDVVRTPSKEGVVQKSQAYVRAGPRRELHFNPRTVNAAIVTCGGLCPGLNNVIREITNTLYHLYDIKGKVYGIRGGYKGFYDERYPPVELTPELVENIHHDGGTVLSSSRGGFDLVKILDFIRSKKIRQLYVIGGDGTHRGAFAIHEGCMEAKMDVSVAGIPKTIDNDVDYIDRSFGFASAVEAAQGAIRSAKTEATCNLPNGIGIVKLMGRSAGFIAVHATLGSGDVDFCLVPEVPIVLEGEKGCLPHLMRRVKRKGFAVIVVAEGAGEVSYFLFLSMREKMRLGKCIHFISL